MSGQARGVSVRHVGVNDEKELEMPKGVEKPKDPVRKTPRLSLKEKRRARKERHAEPVAHRASAL
jgi:hypothetical protein